MRSKKTLIIAGIIIVLLIVIAIVLLLGKDDTTVSSKEKKIEPVELIDEREFYYEEQEGVENKYIEQNLEMFYGKWKSTSEKSDYLFGDVDLTINEDGTWSGTIATAPVNGTWKAGSRCIECSGKWVSFTLAFTESGALVYDEENKGTAVLVKGE